MSYADFDKGIPSKIIRTRQQQVGPDIDTLRRWHESERRLNILRTKRGKEQPPTPEKMRRWIERAAKNNAN